ncbi:MAG: nucleotidyltransferase domain-containing protein [Bacteroidetes bacterium]|nr:MAG: nucleotidyltransferase domain-containing protein [Bacteroidota bacterium]
MKSNKEIIEIIKQTSREYLPDAEVFLFGSRARKNASSDSDYDILLITNVELLPKDKLPIRTKIRKSLLTIGIRSDILIQSKTEVEIKKNLPGHIVRKILREAILL